LHALPAQTHASADGVHFLVARPDCKLGPEARLARDSLDLNGAVTDFRYFQLKEFYHELRVGSGQNDLRPVGSVLDRSHITADAFTHLVLLGRDTLAIRQERLELSQINDDVRAFKPAYRPADDIAGAIFEFRVNQFFFRAAQVLHQCLFGILRG